MEDFKTLIDNKSFFDQPTKNLYVRPQIGNREKHHGKHGKYPKKLRTQ